MEFLLMMIAGVLPVLAFLIYIFIKDSKKEPISLLVKAFVLGMCTYVPAIFIELGIDALLFGDGEAEGFLENAVDSFMVAAFTEESLKLLMLWFVLRKNIFFDEHFDGITYAVFVGLGFAVVENVFYLIDNAQDGWVWLAIFRGLLSVPGHYAFAVLMGYFYSLYHFGGRRFRHLVMTFLAPFLAHGIYNSLLEPMPVVGYFSLVILLVLFYFMQRFCQKKLTEQLDKDRRFVS